MAHIASASSYAHYTIQVGSFMGSWRIVLRFALSLLHSHVHIVTVHGCACDHFFTIMCVCAPSPVHVLDDAIRKLRGPELNLSLHDAKQLIDLMTNARNPNSPKAHEKVTRQGWIVALKREAYWTITCFIFARGIDYSFLHVIIPKERALPLTPVLPNMFSANLAGAFKSSGLRRGSCRSAGRCSRRPG